MDRVEKLAKALFPEEHHDGTDCRGEIGKEGQPCGVCASSRRNWLERVEEVRAALADYDAEA